MSWETVIGLEVHVQLLTRSKIFCGCSSAFGAAPNTQVCPVCLGLPGALPVLNDQAVRLAIRAAVALECRVHLRSVFARKNYFYPDLPKGYQISQFDLPLATDGHITIAMDGVERRVGITRVHLEEDAGKSFHDRMPRATAVDFNRSGVPLIEIVSEPDLRSPAEARAWLVSLKQTLEYLAVSDCNMEEGSLRVDANLSVRRPGHGLGTKQEVKNMNSFAAVERALTQLRDRQVALVDGGGVVELSTFSMATGELRPMRTKEESHDYRYFPDPDLPPLVLSEAEVVAARESLPELPAARRVRYERTHGLSAYDAGVLSATRAVGDHFEAVVAAGAPAKEAAHWIMGPVLADANEHGGAFRVAPSQLASLIALIAGGVVSQQAAKRIFADLAEKGGEPRETAERLGVLQVGDADQLAAWVDDVLGQYPAEASRYRAGETRLLAFFMGSVMKASRGKADPKLVQALLQARLG